MAVTEGETGFRLLGQCPNCDIEDTIYSNPEDQLEPVECRVCSHSWSDWLDLVSQEKTEGNELIPVLIHRSSYWDRNYARQFDQYVLAMYPNQRSIPNVGLVKSLLNAAVMTRFGLDVMFATEGGIQGRYRGNYIALTNSYSEFGLFVEKPLVYQGEGPRQVLDYYEKLLRFTFSTPFTTQGREYKAGTFLRLPREEQTPEAIFRATTDVISRVSRSPRFTSKVVGSIANLQFGKPFLRGLTNQEIADTFVPSPGL